MGQNGADVRPDPIDKAIAATEQQVTMMQVQLPLGSGRPMLVALPSDFSDIEAVQAMQGLLMAMDQMRTQRQVISPGGVLLPSKPTLLRS